MLERLGPDGAAHVVDQHIDALVQLQALGHHGLGTGKGFQIGLEGRCLAASRSDLGHGVLDQVRAVYGQHAAPFGGYTLRHALTNALGRARDNHHLASKSVCVAHAAPVSLVEENFSNKKFWGCTPAPAIHLRTPSTMGGGPHT